MRPTRAVLKLSGLLPLFNEEGLRGAGLWPALVLDEGFLLWICALMAPTGLLEMVYALTLGEALLVYGNRQVQLVHKLLYPTAAVVAAAVGTAVEAVVAEVSVAAVGTAVEAAVVVAAAVEAVLVEAAAIAVVEATGSAVVPAAARTAVEAVLVEAAEKVVAAAVGAAVEAVLVEAAATAVVAATEAAVVPAAA